jgi:tetratricopeptide (TPR) repeat protein
MLKHIIFKKHYLLPFLLILIFSINNVQAQKDSLAYYKTQFEKLKLEKKLESALYSLQKAKKFANSEEKIELLVEEGNVLLDFGLIKNAEEKFNSALESSKNIQNPSLEGLAYKELGYYYRVINNDIESLKCYLKSKEIFKKLGDWDNYYKNVNNIGLYLELEGNCLEAKKNYEETLQYFTKIKDTNSIISVKINLCNLIFAQEGAEKSLVEYKNLLSQKISNPDDLALIHFNIALNYFDLNNYNEANKHIDQAIYITENIKNDNRLIDYYAWKAEIISNFKDYELAYEYYIKAFDKAKKYNDLSFQIGIYESLINNSIEQKKYDSIPTWIEQTYILKDSLNQQESILAHQQINLENKISEHEKDFLRKTHQNKILLYFIFFGIVFTFLIVFSFYFYRKNIHKNLSLSKLKSITLQNQNEINTLENKRIKDELRAQKREMLTSLVFIRNLNNDVQKIVNHIDLIANKSIISKEDMLKLKEEIITRTKNQTQKSNFDKQLTQTQKKFFTELIKMYPDLSNNELKILAYLRVGLSSKEIAEIQNVTIEAVRKTRYRVRKKLNLESDDSLEQFLIKFH